MATEILHGEGGSVTLRHRVNQPGHANRLNRHHAPPPRKAARPRKARTQPVYFCEEKSNLPGGVLVCTTDSWSGKKGPEGKIVVHEMRVIVATGAVTCTCYDFQNDKTRRARSMNWTPALDTPDLQCKHWPKTIGCLKEWGYLLTNNSMPKLPSSPFVQPAFTPVPAMPGSDDDLSDAPRFLRPVRPASGVANLTEAGFAPDEDLSDAAPDAAECAALPDPRFTPDPNNPGFMMNGDKDWVAHFEAME